MQRTWISSWTTLLLLAAVGATADDWPQWQGPDRNAISKEQGLLQEWPEEGPKLAWKVDGLGTGFSTPSLAGGRIYGMSHQDGQEVVWAISEKDGSPIWVTRLGKVFDQAYPQAKEGPGSTPTVDGDRLYVQGLAGDVSCLRVEAGEVLWQRSLQKDFGAKVPEWSFRESPLVMGEKVVVTPGGPKATLVALDRETGETIWTSLAPGSPGPAYSSPIAIEFEGAWQIVQFTAKNVLGVAADDGTFLWSYEAPSNEYGINCSTPLHDRGRIFAASAYDNGGGLASLQRAEDGRLEAGEVYFTRNMQNHHGGMVLLDGVLYGANGGNSGGYLVALDFATGEVHWNERSGRRAPKGSIAYADGRIYYRLEDGTMLLVEPSRQAYLERGRFEQPDRSGQPAWAHPIIANGKLYLRDQGKLFVYDVRSAGPD